MVEFSIGVTKCSATDFFFFFYPFIYEKIFIGSISSSLPINNMLNNLHESHPLTGLLCVAETCHGQTDLG
jgi:hypothetical protein